MLKLPCVVVGCNRDQTWGHVMGDDDWQGEDIFLSPPNLGGDL